MMSARWLPIPADIDELARRVDAGETIDQIASRFGISSRTIFRCLKANPELAQQLAAARPRRMTADHGTPGLYNSGCRCEVCTDANRERIYKIRARLNSQLDRAPHGTPSAYVNWGCRCEECRKAGSIKNKQDAAARKARGDQR